ncbi:hypothetical protein INT47_007639 [Mucor saturninus]|uniref:Uncharacterized protein n=1 Tax=Mucor saturninus TaxID=64648 RepID=A0A8H7R9K9_9FUNG|nr:hypothetical protein INT47_007639 [Mucor saturninus]
MSTKNSSEECENSSDDDFDTFVIKLDDKKRRALATKLALDGQGQWSDEDIELLLQELEIEVGEGTNRFLYEDERRLYCLFLSQAIPFEHTKSPEQIYDKILWLWSTWEAISRATGKSWWNTTEQEKQRLSLMADNKDQQLKSQFKYFDMCDRIFAYILEEEGENDDHLKIEGSIYY